MVQPEILAKLAENSNAKYREGLPTFSSTITELMQKSTRLDAKIDAITDRILESKGTAENAIWNSKLHKIQAERESHEKQIVALKARQQTFHYEDLDPKRLELAIENLIVSFDGLDGGRKHLMVSSIVDRVEIKRDSIGISLKNPFKQLDVDQGMQFFYQKEHWLRKPLQEPSSAGAALD